MEKSVVLAGNPQGGKGGGGGGSCEAPTGNFVGLSAWGGSGGRGTELGDPPLVGLSAGGGRGGGGGKVREGLLAAGGGGGGTGRLGRAVPAREVLGGSGGTAGPGLSDGFEGLLPAFAALFGGAAALGTTARTPGSCPGLPPEKKITPYILVFCSISSDKTAQKTLFIFPPQWSLRVIK